MMAAYTIAVDQAQTNQHQLDIHYYNLHKELKATFNTLGIAV